MGAHQVTHAAARLAQLKHRWERILDELKVVEGDDFLNCNFSILILVGSLNKVLHKVADQ